MKCPRCGATQRLPGLVAGPKGAGQAFGPPPGAWPVLQGPLWLANARLLCPHAGADLI